MYNVSEISFKAMKNKEETCKTIKDLHLTARTKERIVTIFEEVTIMQIIDINPAEFISIAIESIN